MQQPILGINDSINSLYLQGRTKSWGGDDFADLDLSLININLK